ncbi:MAG: hypothetical protein IJ174_04920 [Clostridia bacterium]|nr:hypothetical protein [Clostridia bacterium]
MLRKAKPASANAEKALQAMQTSLADIAAESWRFDLALQRVVKRMDVMEAERFLRQYEYFTDRVRTALEKADIVCVDLTGQPYDPGMAAQAMNLDEFEEDEALIVTRTIEPVILHGGRVMKTGMVMVGRAENGNEA